MECSVERTLCLDGSRDVRAAMSKAASLRSFIKEYAGNPSKLLADRCVELGDALLAGNAQQNILNHTESTLDKARQQLEACGVTNELLASLATPDEACRCCLQEEETLGCVDEAYAALKELSQQQSNVPAASLAECPVPPYLKAFHENATTTIAAALNNAEQVLATFDDLVVIKHFAQTQVDHFKRECRVYSSVQHPFVGELVTAFSDDDGLHTVMPRYGGGTADAWMGVHCDDAFPTMRVLRQAADGLKCLHLAGVCHCDFKPLNIVMTSAAHHGSPKLIDFGCADVKETATVLLNRAHTQTMKSLAGFTPQYVAPEVAQKLEESISNYSPTAAAAQAETFATVVTPALDVYAFGRWMSEVLQCPATFEKEFAGGDSSEVITLPDTFGSLST